MSPNFIFHFGLILLWFHPFILGKKLAPEPDDDPWIHSETPKELEKKLRKFREELDKWGGLDNNEACVSVDKSELAKAYGIMNDALEIRNTKWYLEEAKYDMFDPKKTGPYEAKIMLDNELLNLKNGKSKPSLCPYTKGMYCNAGNKCQCKNGVEQFHPRPLNPPKVEYDAKSKVCYLVDRSSCSDHWQTKCDSHRKCLMPLNEDTSCTIFNLEVLDRFKLDATAGKEVCTCQCDYDASNLKNLLTSIQYQNPPYLIKYGDSCKPEYETYYEDLVKAVAIKVTSSYEFYRLHKVDFNNLGVDMSTPTLCNKNDNTTKFSRLVCENSTTTPKCACKYNGVWDDSTKSCSLKSGSICDGYDNLPYPCPTGEKCIFESKPVFCTEQNLNDLSDFDEISKSCKCTSESKTPFKSHFSAQDLQDFEKESHQNIANKLKTFHHVQTTGRKRRSTDLSNPSKWTILAMNERCNWTTDRAYFQMDDYIRADLAHVYYKTRFRQEIQDIIDNGTAKICDLSKSMRCNFITETCSCPTDGYLMKNIESEYNSTLDRCFLKKGSLCHPTLTEWLPCQEGEQCVYHDVPILCTRKNQKKIVKNKMILNTAECYCFSKDMKVINDNEQIDAGLVKKFKRVRKIEL